MRASLDQYAAAHYDTTGDAIASIQRLGAGCFLVKLGTDAEVERLCVFVRIPPAADKTEGPTNCVTFAGIELDTCTMEVRQNKLIKVIAKIQAVQKCKNVTLQELQSISGLLILQAGWSGQGGVFLCAD